MSKSTTARRAMLSLSAAAVGLATLPPAVTANAVPPPVAPKLTAIAIATDLQAGGLPLTDLIEGPTYKTGATYTWSQAYFRDLRVVRGAQDPGPQPLCSAQAPSEATDISCGGDIYVWTSHTLAASSARTTCGGFRYRFVAGEVSLAVSWYLSSRLTVAQAMTYKRPLAAIVGGPATFFGPCPRPPKPEL